MESSATAPTQSAKTEVAKVPSRVIDSSVAAKWFLPEEHSERARSLLEHDARLVAPDLLLIELANVFRKRGRRGQAPPALFEEALLALEAMPLEFVPLASLLVSAASLARETGQAVYDCLFLALAIDRRIPLTTADQRFFAAISGSPHSELIEWIGSPEA